MYMKEPLMGTTYQENANQTMLAHQLLVRKEGLKNVLQGHEQERPIEPIILNTYDLALQKNTPLTKPREC